MDPIFLALGELLKKISDPVVIVLLVLLFSAEWRNWAQSREAREDRKILVTALDNITAKIGDSLQQIKNTISAMTGRPLQ